MSVHTLTETSAKAIVDHVSAASEQQVNSMRSIALLALLAIAACADTSEILPPFALIPLALLQGAIAVEIYGYTWHRWGEHIGAMTALTRFVGLRIVQAKHQYHHYIAYHMPKHTRNENEEYRSAETIAWSWIIPALPIVLSHVWLWGFTLHSAFWVLGFAGCGWLLGQGHTWLHDQNHFFSRLLPAKRQTVLRQLHFLHHLNVRTNFGILFFAVDRLLGSYEAPAALKTKYGALRPRFGQVVAFQNAQDLFRYAPNSETARAIMGEGGQAATMLPEVAEIAKIAGYKDEDPFFAHLEALQREFGIA